MAIGCVRNHAVSEAIRDSMEESKAVTGGFEVGLPPCSYPNYPLTYSLKTGFCSL